MYQYRETGSVTGHSATRPRLARTSHRVEWAHWTAPTAHPVPLTHVGEINRVRPDAFSVTEWAEGGGKLTTSGEERYAG